jgi:hypothetical protein
MADRLLGRARDRYVCWALTLGALYDEVTQFELPRLLQHGCVSRPVQPWPRPRRSCPSQTRGRIALTISVATASMSAVAPVRPTCCSAQVGLEPTGKAAELVSGPVCSTGAGVLARRAVPKASSQLAAGMVEVSSPSTEREDLVDKMAQYAAAGIPAYLAVRMSATGAIIDAREFHLDAATYQYRVETLMEHGVVLTHPFKVAVPFEELVE